MGTTPVTYEQFRRRLKANRTLKEAIYTPAEVKSKTRDYWSNRDWIRKANLIANDIRFKGEWLDHVFRKADNEYLPNTDKDMSYEKLFPKPTLRNRFKNLFRR